MSKIKPFLMFLFGFCILLVGCLVVPQQTASEEIRPEIETITQSKHDFAIAVLSETGIAEQYDLYLGNSIDISVPLETTRNEKFMEWMQALFVQEAGWNYIAASYIAQLEETFSETELSELMTLTNQPLIRRLVQAEMAAYAASAEERRSLLSTLWEKYNRGVFTPPDELWR